MMDDRDLEEMIKELDTLESIDQIVETIYEIVSSHEMLDDVNAQYQAVVEVSWFYPSTNKHDAWPQIFDYTDKWEEAWLKCFEDYAGIPVYAGNNQQLLLASKFFI